MTDRAVDAFDARLAERLAEYGDHAMPPYDVAAIAGTAIESRRSRRRAIGERGLGRLGIVLLAAALGLMALAALAGGSPRPGPLRIVVGPRGPIAASYRMNAGPDASVIVENRSGRRWVPSGLVEKDFLCHPLGGAPTIYPCIVRPYATVEFQEPYLVPGDVLEVRFSPDGAPATEGIPVHIDVDKAP